MKPNKPYPSFPLTPHNRGGWAKKYRGHQLYLPDPDPERALADFHRRAAAIDHGTELPRRRGPCVTVGEVVSRYVAERLRDRNAGTLSRHAYDDYALCLKRFVAGLGRDTPLSTLTPDHFTSLYRRWSAKWHGHQLRHLVSTAKFCFNHADRNDWIPRVPKYGTMFRAPAPTKRKAPPLTVEQIRALLGHATGQMRAMILLGANCGYGQKDCSSLPRAAVDFARNVIVFPRPKMQKRNPIDRACVLWPETVDALRAVMSERPDDALVFRTSHGNPWVVDGKDAVIRQFQSVCTAAGLPRLGFYGLRHLFRTLADELEKPHAAARIMGHRLPGLAQVYVDAIEHGRLQVITDHVRSKILRTPVSDVPAPRRSADASMSIG